MDCPPGDVGIGAKPIVDASLVCSDQQLAARRWTDKNAVAWAEMPEDFTAFLTSFLPLSYIREHFRFYTTDNGASLQGYAPLVNVQLDYGCETIFCIIERMGENDILWDGPSQTWQVNIDRAEATRRTEAAGCDVSNLALSLSGYNSPIPGVDGQHLSQSFYPAWVAGGKAADCAPHVCDKYAPGNCGCYGPRCFLNADDGTLRVAQGSTWYKGPPTAQ